MCKPKVPKVNSSVSEVAQAAPFVPVGALESVMTGPRIADVDALKPRRTNPLRIVGAGRPVTTPSTAVTGGNRAGGVTVLKARAQTPGTIPYVPYRPTRPVTPPAPPPLPRPELPGSVGKPPRRSPTVGPDGVFRPPRDGSANK